MLIDWVTAAPAHGKAEEGTLYEAQSWSAIGAFLFGPDPAKALTPAPGTAGANGKPPIKVWHCATFCFTSRLLPRKRWTDTSCRRA